jgi:hypothetical protein
MINRYQLISLLIEELKLTENERPFLAKLSDTILCKDCGYKPLRKGYYLLKL